MYLHRSTFIYPTFSELMEDKVPKQKDDGRHTLSVRNNDGHHGAVVSNRKPEGISSVTPQNSSSMWNGEGNSNTVNDLMKMSHQGFGNDRGKYLKLMFLTFRK